MKSIFSTALIYALIFPSVVFHFEAC